jgi:hypothetical protein
VDKLVARFDAHVAAEQYGKADAVFAQLQEMGIELEDQGDHSAWSYAEVRPDEPRHVPTKAKGAAKSVDACTPPPAVPVARKKKELGKSAIKRRAAKEAQERRERDAAKIDKATKRERIKAHLAEKAKKLKEKEKADIKAEDERFRSHTEQSDRREKLAKGGGKEMTKSKLKRKKNRAKPSQKKRNGK